MTEHYQFTFLLLIFIAGVLVALSGASKQSNKCFEDISGIYLRRYTDGDESTKNDYALLLFFKTGALVQADSAEKQDASAYTSDRAGFYECSTGSKSGVEKIKFGATYFGESGNESVIVVQSDVTCKGAVSDCSDDAVRCRDGQSRSKTYPFELPDPNTGQYRNPIPDSKLTEQFELQRISKHSKMSSQNSQSCYTDLSGVYVTAYPDGSYGLTAYVSSGYIYTFDSAQRDSTGVFLSGTSFGTWDCTDSGSIGGFYNYFTYSNGESDQSIVDGSFYMQCSSGTYNNCTGRYSQISCPLQYGFKPFRNCQTANGVSSSFNAARLQKAPAIKKCHRTFGGVYTLETDIPATGANLLYTITLFPNAFTYVTGTFEADPRARVSNILGTWDCDSNGNIMVSDVYIRYPIPERNVTEGLNTDILDLQCDSKTGQCAGTVYISATTVFGLPVNGVLPTDMYYFNGTVRGSEVKLDAPQ